MLRALVAGERDGAVLAELAKGTLRQKRSQLAAALTGRFTTHHAVLLQELLDHIEYLEAAIGRFDQRIEDGYRWQQGRDRTQEINRLCKVLEDAGLKLKSVVSDVMGASGRAMLTALITGTTDAAVLAQGKLRRKLPELRRAVEGRFRSHHAFLIEQIFAKIDFLDETMRRLTAELDRRLLPFEPILTALDTIPGVDRKTATIIVAETGADMARHRGQIPSQLDPKLALRSQDDRFNQPAEHL
jgi:transposase